MKDGNPNNSGMYSTVPSEPPPSYDEAMHLPQVHNITMPEPSAPTLQTTIPIPSAPILEAPTSQTQPHEIGFTTTNIRSESPIVTQPQVQTTEPFQRNYQYVDEQRFRQKRDNNNDDDNCDCCSADCCEGCCYLCMCCLYSCEIIVDCLRLIAECAK